MFSYAAAFLSKESQLLFKELGVSKELHLTTCFDSSGTINGTHNILLTKPLVATIKNILHWNTKNGVYLIAELENCDWSKETNEYFKSLGAIEDLPHKAHLTLMKNENKELQNSLMNLVGKKIYFDRHSVRVKDN